MLEVLTIITYIGSMKTWNPQRAKELIEQKGFTRRHLAKCLGVTLSTFQGMMSGRSPGKFSLFLMAETLGTNTDYLDFRSEDPRPKKGHVA